jgi:hypothetical protein
MDDDFYEERARQIREVPAQADPFIKTRLVRFAGNYDAMIARTRPAVSSNLPDVSADKFAEKRVRQKDYDWIPYGRSPINGRPIIGRIFGIAD